VLTELHNKVIKLQ